MFEWLSDNRAAIASLIILMFFVSFFWSAYIGIRAKFIDVDQEVFGDPERTKGGWYWSLCGVSVLMLLWFYFSWGVGRAYFPNAANEMCQVAKIEQAISPISAALTIKSRYYKSTALVKRNVEQLEDLKSRIMMFDQTLAEVIELKLIVSSIQKILALLSNPNLLSSETSKEIELIASQLDFLGEKFNQDYFQLIVSEEALSQPLWGTSEIEIPMMPRTKKGVFYDALSVEVQAVSKQFLRIRHLPKTAESLIERTRDRIEIFKGSLEDLGIDSVAKSNLASLIKYTDRIFKRVDDGNIFPPGTMSIVTISTINFLDRMEVSKGALATVDRWFFPGRGVVKSKTQCTEQGSARWLPKPTDVVSTFTVLANPDIKNGGGYKGTPLLWWDWISIGGLVGFFIPDFFVDIFTTNYSEHSEIGTFDPNIYDNLLKLAKGEIHLGYLPFPTGHIWDSLVRVVLAMFFGILLGVPLGIYMGISRFFKSFFDPLIELYRPVPPLAWAPLILTIFGIQDDGKIFLLFMVAFAIMVISARTGASGTQLSKVRASHSLGANDSQVLRYVILPNALPEILTGVRISIGVCWGTLVAAEMLAGTTGVGFIENVARTVSDYELIWVTILIMGLLGLLFDIGMRLLIAKLIPWRGKG